MRGNISESVLVVHEKERKLRIKQYLDKVQIKIFR